MQSDPLSGLAHTIQLAVAPVFLFSGIGSILGVLTNRLARIIDRTRVLEAVPAGDARTEGWRAELRALRARARLINRAIGLCTYSALLVAAVVAAIFLGAVARIDLTVAVVVAFVAATLALIVGLVHFLGEVHLATAQMRDAPQPD
jgi:hypothetical protein